MPMVIRTFTALCEQCGPAVFGYESGKDADQDPVWCKNCGNKETFVDAEARWHPEEPTRAAEPTRVAEPKRDTQSCFQKQDMYALMD